MTTQLTSSSPRTYQVITYGCQMNVHDSERIAGLLEHAGLVAAPEPSGELADADVVVFNTCAVRENADNRLYGNLGHMAKIKRGRPGMQIAVGGCMAQKDRDLITTKAPWVDVVFGTNNLGSLPVLLERARITDEAQVEIKEALQTFPSNLPTHRDSAYAAWVSISVGCNNTCTFCIVPSLRGKETDRRPGEILREIEMLVSEGVQEITLLGQNVNTYGVEFGDRSAFAQLLRSVGEVDGLERVRFTSPHPASFTNDVIEAMATTHNVMPSLHMPLQSGSDRVLKAMRRSYRKDRFLRILDDVRSAMPHAAITTDIIVGFPGETEEDFEQTLEVVRRARFSAAFTFQYSIRPGTPAATMPDQVPADVVQERYERLVAEIEQISWEENKALVGSTAEVLFAAGEGRKDERTSRVSGRSRDNRLVHVAMPDDPAFRPRPGDIAEVEITHAAPHHLVADAPIRNLRRTRGGDAWQAAQTPRPAGVGLGLPTVAGIR
ncbi:tRNA (N6-isopentenyl adenosine(37)-C2)-methylthiotransferase MiaB [Propionimicrobium sp. PCR01-08-3]|uniref:tRNA (N6-isopentenyl adenosine(37)-C2)-methylthiotransferase MiaB n=1 Tax=Propionimicrobium sp. PCR01-08-3 TaxID=3052086 RepID=UPI00255C6DE3|nr:tRNA (N6-isopentenyl adenosine(37)-C2)-methylthiotransferase MiaB [Propionimicrobium sp. PCR01-08-3]WIY83648.1 tRNA (N6-isopentenyl adenosine(37)-C2)-methylthiotransferase MiaB [Propionimicrobium sp. PCR01-08-3]